MRTPKTALLTLALLAFAPAAAQADLEHTYVSGVGNDANPDCTRTAPCKTFAGAISKTNEGGAISALDSAGYGAVTITKSITIDGEGSQSSILSSGTNAIIVNAQADDTVTLRNLAINGPGAGQAQPCGWTGLNGVRILRAASVTLENVAIDHVRNAGVSVTPFAGTSANLVLSLRHVDIKSACDQGINLAQVDGRTVDATIDDSTIDTSAIGIRAADGANVLLSNSALFATPTALARVGTGAIHDGTGNVFAAIGDNTSVFSDVSGRRGRGARNTAAPSCVARLKGMTLATAERRLHAAGCVVGRLGTRRAAGRAGRVLKATAAGRAVILVVSR